MLKLASRNKIIFLLFAGLAVASADARFNVQKGTGTERQAWTGPSGRFTVTATNRNITVSPTGEPSKVILSARNTALRELSTFKRENVDGEPSSWRCTYRLEFRLLSLVGSLLSYEQHEDSYCGRVNGQGWNHPSTQTSYHVIDLDQPGRRIDLTNFFSQSSVLNALLSDPAVKEALKTSETSIPPENLAQLIATLSTGARIKPTVATEASPEGCEFVLPEQPLAQFAFHHLENGKVAVRLSLEPSSGACHTAHSQLGILLPTPASLNALLSAAQSRAQGFLMKDGRELFGGRPTVFEFEARGASGRRKR